MTVKNRFAQMRDVGDWLEDETGETWHLHRVQHEYLLPMFRMTDEGATDSEAKDSVCEELGIAPGRRSAGMLHLERAVHGRKLSK